MPKLHLVGITPDHKGLVLSEHARSKRGDLVLEIDDRLLDAIEKAKRLRAREEGRSLESAALPSKREEEPGDGTPATRLSPREIQKRLRMGETVAGLAKSSGVDEAWIERFAVPVLAEQARIIERARATTYVRARVGPSGVTLGPAVAANVIDKGVPLTLPDIEAGWGAFQRPGGEWCVTFSFPHRGRRQTAEWEFDQATGELTARGKLAAELAYREPGKRLPQPPPARPPAATAPPAAAPPAAAQAPAETEEAAAATSAEAPDAVQTLPGTAEAGGLPAGATGAAGLPERPAPSPLTRPPAPEPKTPVAKKAAAPKKPVAGKATAKKTTPAKAPVAKKAPLAEPTDETRKAAAARKPGDPAEPAAPPVSEEPAAPAASEEPAAPPVSEEPAAPAASEEPAAAPVSEEPAAAPVSEEPAEAPVSEEAVPPAATGEPPAAPAEMEPAADAPETASRPSEDAEPTGPNSLRNHPAENALRAAPPPR